ncbi:MAG TPA: ABC transporter permease [Candidatus Sulfopaludibacter sp.]|jgi:predicted permease|nr:ABC transporter permease [Candidatus Sulfopaludibacter sp.]
MNEFAANLRHAVRSLRRNPAFTLTSLLSLAIGIGANTAIFSVANALLLRPLPYRDADRLAILWNRSPGLDIAQDWFSPAQYIDIRESHAFEQVAIAIGGFFNLTGDGEPERVGATRVSSSLLPMLGARPRWGRLIAPEEDAPGHAPVAVLTDSLWARRYGSDPRIVGRSIQINGAAYQVVGVLPRGFSLPHEVLPTLYGTEQTEILLSLPLSANAAHNRGQEDYNVLAKLRRGVSLRQAQSRMDGLTARLRRDFPDDYPPNGGLTFGVVPLLDQVVGNVRRMLLVLLAAVGFVLAIACANVANLTLSRALARQKEMSLRSALGASRARIVIPLLTESVLLALCGGALGVVFAGWSIQAIRTYGAGTVPRLADIGIDGEALLFTLLLSAACGILFGLAPALRLSRLDLNTALKSGGRGAVWARGNSLRRLLVVAELALSVVLLIGAGLLIRSFTRLQGVPPGFNPRNVLTFDLTLAGRKYADPQVALHTYQDIWGRLEALPGVIAAGGVTSIPLSNAFAWTPITIEGRVPPPGEKFINADERVVANHYFEAMGIPLRRGRFFNDGDTPDKPRVAIVDEHLAQQYWPNQDPIGKRIHMVQRTAEPWQTVVGVVGQIKHESLDGDSRIAFYLSHTQSVSRALTVTLHSGSDPAGLTGAVRQEIRAVDPDLPMYSVRSMQQRVEDSLAQRRFFKLLLALFAALALALAAVGIYGVMAYLVSQGTREIGIRVALGATPRTIQTLILRQSAALAAAGLIGGLAGAFTLTRLMRSLLFGVEATDGFTYLATAILLAGISLAAALIPARRAARIDAMTSLRAE